ncbi:MAG: hypothetical protein R2940_07875 [Syntrophotaleaceae bacterium]
MEDKDKENDYDNDYDNDNEGRATTAAGFSGAFTPHPSPLTPSNNHQT